MDVYDVSEDTAAVIAAIADQSELITGAVVIVAALVGMIIGYLAISELLRIWLS